MGFSKHTVILAALIFFAQPSWGTASCEDYLLRPMNIERLGFGRTTKSADEIVFTGTTQPAPFGGQLRVIQRLGGSWNSSASATGLQGTDIVGDPRWLAAIIGPDLGCYFGFCQIDRSHITVPDADAFNGAIRKANSKLLQRQKEPIPVQFVEVNISVPLKSNAYVDLFLNNQIPLEKTGALAIHDIAFHTSIIFLPTSALRSYQSKVKLALEYIEFLRSRNRFGQDTGKILQEMLDNLVARIDQFGNLSVSYEWTRTSWFVRKLSELGHFIEGTDPFAKWLMSIGLEETPRDYLFMLPFSEEFLIDEFFAFRGSKEFHHYNGEVIQENSKTSREGMQQLGSYLRKSFADRIEDFQILLEKN